jgi:FkbM family methyltransferase
LIVKFLKRQWQQYRLQHAGLCEPAPSPPLYVGAWAVWPQILGPQSVVYSFGVGDNINWDLKMIRRFGLTVHAFDPTPASIAWIARQQLPPQFIFHDCGISNFDGALDFYPPKRRGGTHFSQERRGGPLDRRPPVRGRVERLSTIMQRLGHQRIDLLKLDVEGAEFEAIPNLIDSAVAVDQLLVEIHYQFPARSFRVAIDLVQQLKRYGMQCLHVSPRGYEFSFVRRELVDQPLSFQERRKAA